MSRIAWRLNLDADHEMRRPLGYTPSRPVSERVQAMQRRLPELVGVDDVVVGKDTSLATSFVGRCWCPTPTALRDLRRAGVTLPPVPPFEVVRRVNHRRFAFDLGSVLEGSVWIDDLASLQDALRGAPAGDWVLKRPFSVAGSGRRILRAGAMGPTDEAWLQASFTEGGVLLEPWLRLRDELALHGYLHAGGELVVGSVCSQRTDAYGSWLGTEVVTTLASADSTALEQAARRVGAALTAAGYFGPFGIDAYRFEHHGEVALNPCSEINARYTMGWAVGMGERRPDRAD